MPAEFEELVELDGVGSGGGPLPSVMAGAPVAGELTRRHADSETESTPQRGRRLGSW